MKTYFELSEVAQEVADSLEEQLYDCKEDRLSGDMLNLITLTVLNTLDNWTPRLTTSMREEVLNWFQSEYGLCL